jgi:hypothetical protein
MSRRAARLRITLLGESAMWTRFFLAPAAAATILAASPDLVAVDLKPKTLAAFDRYVKLTEDRIATELDGRQPFLRIKRLPAAAQTDAMTRLKRGEVVSERLQTWEAGKKIAADDAMIHHWIGSVLLPGVSLTKARAVVERYEEYPRVLGPMVQRAKILERTGSDFLVQMRTSVTKGITVVMDGDYRIEYRAIGQSKLYTRSVVTNVFEVQSAGAADERRVEGDKSGGYLWRLNTYCSFEESQQGTVEQCESVSLTRSIPFPFGFIVGPFVNSIPRETLAFTLGRVREEAMKPVKTTQAR